MSKFKPLTGNHGDFSGIVLKAAAGGHLEAVKHYLKRNPDWLNQVGPHGRTLLWEAAYKGRTALVQWLIKAGAHIHAIGSYYTPMHVELSAIAAARHAGRDEVVTILKKHGAKDDFYAACHRGDLAAMKKFISKNKSIINRPMGNRPPRPRMGYHPIHYSVVGGQVPAVEFLIKAGAKTAEHMPLLLDWCEINRSTIAPMIRKAAESEKPGSTRQKKLQPGVPAIDQPNWLGFPELVDECRGNHNATDDPARVATVLDRGANINVADYKGKTALHRAAQAGFIFITQLLLDRGCDTEIADNRNETAIFDAINYARCETVKLLLKHGVDREHRNFRGDTPIIAAARGKSFETFELLIQAKAKLEVVNNKGQSIVDILSRTRNTSPQRKRMLEYFNKLQSRPKPRKSK